MLRFCSHAHCILQLHDVETTKKRHVGALVAKHGQSFADIKLYFNEITHSNLDLIKLLKEEVRLAVVSHSEVGYRTSQHDYRSLATFSVSLLLLAARRATPARGR